MYIFRTLVMDEWKKMYSNNDTMKVAMPYFWENFDHENYSIWTCEYKYPKELTLIFMSCNLIGGMYFKGDTFSILFNFNFRWSKLVW